MLAGAAHTPLLASAVLFLVGCVSTVLNRHGLAEPRLIRPAAVAVKLPTSPHSQLHEPYVHDLRSSKYYRGLCRPEDGCRVATRNGSALAAQTACTPKLLKGWTGAGSWAVDDAGHYRCGCGVKQASCDSWVAALHLQHKQLCCAHIQTTCGSQNTRRMFASPPCLPFSAAGSPATAGCGAWQQRRPGSA